MSSSHIAILACHLEFGVTFKMCMQEIKAVMESLSIYTDISFSG